MYFYLIAVVVILLDQLTKWLIVQNMEIGESITIIENLLYITSHRNSGAAWGILQDQMIFFYVLTTVFVVGIIWFVHKHGTKDKLFIIGMGLILGGALGNFIDRLFHQEVVDFVHTIIFGYNFPIFNVADASLCVGVVLIFIQTILEVKKEKTK